MLIMPLLVLLATMDSRERSIGTRPDAELVNSMLDAAIEMVADINAQPVLHSDRGAPTIAGPGGSRGVRSNTERASALRRNPVQDFSRPPLWLSSNVRIRLSRNVGFRRLLALMVLDRSSVEGRRLNGQGAYASGDPSSRPTARFASWGLRLRLLLRQLLDRVIQIGLRELARFLRAQCAVR